MFRDTDVHIGRRLRQARLARGLSQHALGRKLGITYQQVQKYETGANRIGGSRLWDACGVLNVAVGYFFEGLPSAQGTSADQGETLVSRRCLALARDIEAIGDDMVKLRIAGLIRAIARPGQAESCESLPDGS